VYTEICNGSCFDFGARSSCGRVYATFWDDFGDQQETVSYGSKACTENEGIDEEIKKGNPETLCKRVQLVRIDKCPENTNLAGD
jgi:hypothetical protein